MNLHNRSGNISTLVYTKYWMLPKHTDIFQGIHRYCVQKTGCWYVQDDAVWAWSEDPSLLFITVGHLVDAVIAVATHVWIWVQDGWVMLVSPPYSACTKGTWRTFCQTKIWTIALSLSPQSSGKFLLIDLIWSEVASGQLFDHFILPIGWKSDNKY